MLFGFVSRQMSLTNTWAALTRTGGNYTDDGSDVSDGTYRPKVVHLGQYVPPGFAYFIFPPEASLMMTLTNTSIQADLRFRGQHPH
jgi:hypothetical protein